MNPNQDLSELKDMADAQREQNKGMVWLMELPGEIIPELSDSRPLVRLARKHAIPLARRRRPGENTSNNGWAVSKEDARRLIELFYQGE